MSTWRDYQRQVCEIGGDIHRSLTGALGPVFAAEEQFVLGRNGPHRIDVLIKSGRSAFFIECKYYPNEPIAKPQVTSTIYDFLDVCRANTDYTWSLVFVSPTEIPPKARIPALRSDGIYLSPSNLSGGSLANSTHFVFFKPPEGPRDAAPFFITSDDGSRAHFTGGSRELSRDRMIERLHDPRRQLWERVHAGLALFAQEPESFVSDPHAHRSLIHGLMHLGRSQEALYVRRFGARDVRDVAGARIEELMMRFQLAQRRYRRAASPGADSIAEMRKMLGGLSLLDDVSTKAFIAPIIARRGSKEEGLSLLASIEDRVRALDIVEAPYFEALRLVRTAQLVDSPTQRQELLSSAQLVVGELPIWNRLIGDALISAVETDLRTLHGIDVPFDVEEWSTGPKVAT
jgi:hypothetical protein